MARNRSKHDRSSKGVFTVQNLVWLCLLLVAAWIVYIVVIIGGDRSVVSPGESSLGPISTANVLSVRGVPTLVSPPRPSQVVEPMTAPPRISPRVPAIVESIDTETEHVPMERTPPELTVTVTKWKPDSGTDKNSGLDLERTGVEEQSGESEFSDESPVVVMHTIVQERTVEQLKGHYMNRMGPARIAELYPHNGLDQLLVHLSAQPQCRDTPIFVAMASVVNELYWQLVENFIYSMTHFEVSDCALMICVSDLHCMKKCRESHFPCFLYQYENVYGDNELEAEYYKQHRGQTQRPVSALEQIANLKMYYLPRALALGVYLFVLDLDVGWIHNPMELVRYHHEHKPDVDILVQYDWGFEMDRSVEKWKTWYVQPIVNIGVFLCRGNARTTRMFEMAWNEYKTDCLIKIRNQPGKDQNKVLGAMGRARNGKVGLRWEYFPNASAVLIDKIQKFHTNLVELGGELSESLLSTELIKHYPASIILKGRGRGLNNGESGLVGNTGSSVRAVAAHTTCYEKATKVTGLKAVSAFWNPFYYDPTRPTLTKQLVYTTPEALVQELQSLVYIAIATRRALIIPNLLGDPSQPSVRPRFKTSFNYFDLYDNHRQATSSRRRSDSASNEFHFTGRVRSGHTEDVRPDEPGHNWIALWPGFRVLYTEPATSMKNSYFRHLFDSLQVLEATFYWRMVTHYGTAAPEPTVRVYDVKDVSVPSNRRMNTPDALEFHGKGLDTIIRDIRALDRAAHPRVVIHVCDTSRVRTEPGVSTRAEYVAGRDEYVAASLARAAVLPLFSREAVAEDGRDVPVTAPVTLGGSSPAVLSVVSKLLFWLNDSVGATWDYSPPSPRSDPDGPGWGDTNTDIDTVSAGTDAYTYLPMSYANLRAQYQPLPAIITRKHSFHTHIRTNYMNILNITGAVSGLKGSQHLVQLHETMQFQTKNTVRSCAHIFRISSNRSCFDKCK